MLDVKCQMCGNWFIIKEYPFDSTLNCPFCQANVENTNNRIKERNSKRYDGFALASIYNAAASLVLFLIYLGSAQPLASLSAMSSMIARFGLVFALVSLGMSISDKSIDRVQGIIGGIACLILSLV